MVLPGDLIPWEGKSPIRGEKYGADWDGSIIHHEGGTGGLPISLVLADDTAYTILMYYIHLLHYI